MFKFLPLLAFLAIFAGRAVAQSDLPVDESIAKWEEAVKQKITADQIFYPENLAGRWKDTDDAQRKKIQTLASKNLKSRDKDVRERTVAALGSMTGGTKNVYADQSAKLLIGESQKKTTEEDVGYFAAVLDALGKTQSTKAVPVLTKLLNYKDSAIISATASSLAHFRESALSVRKGLVEELLKTYTGAYNAARADPRNTTAKDKHEAIKGAMESSLKTLTGQQLQGSDVWWKWWNDTGKKSKDW